MALELHDLRSLIVMARHRSLRQAAIEMNVRQSTLSRRLHSMDHDLGVRLFERSTAGTRLSDVGHEFLAKARQIVEEADTAFARLRTRALGKTGQLTIGVYTSFSTGNLWATLREHRERFPDVDVHTVDGQRDHLFGDLATGLIDLVIMTTSRMEWSGSTASLWSERVIVALSKQHPLAASPVLRWSDLKGEKLLLPERDPAPEFMQVLIAKLGGAAFDRASPQDVPLDRLLSLVSIGYGALLVLEGGTGGQYKDVVYREIHDDNGATRLNFTAFWRKENANPALRPFLDILRTRYPDLSIAPRDANGSAAPRP